MAVSEEDRGNRFTNLAAIGFSEVPSDSRTYWADKAFELSGQDPRVYASIMLADENHRSDEFTLWTTLNFDPEAYQSDMYLATHWGDKAFQIGDGGNEGQKNYDHILGVDQGKRS